MIDKFNGEYRFLSNFYLCKIIFEGEEYKSVEHAYQAAKTTDLSSRHIIQTLATAKEARQAGRYITLRKDWKNIKLEVMYTLVHYKFFNNPTLGNKLLSTGNDELIEGNYWNDCFWGVCRGKGKNHLGKILMHVRDSLREYELRQ